MKRHWQLFTSNLYLSSFTFGGGYVMVPLMKRKFVEDLAWIADEEMNDLIAIAQSSPGSIAINTSILVGYKVAGFTGAVVSCLGTMLPPIFILSLVSLFYHQFRENRYVASALLTMQAGVAAVILNVVYTMAGQIVQTKQVLLIMMMLISFLAAYFWRVNVLILILLSGLIGAISSLRSEGQ